MARGAVKYGERNWEKAAGEAEISRFQASALRHIYQWLDGDSTEDHAVAVAFNLAGAEMVKYKMKEGTIITGKSPDGPIDMKGCPCDLGLPPVGGICCCECHTKGLAF
jgi:hypothetical protein